MFFSDILTLKWHIINIVKNKKFIKYGTLSLYIYIYSHRFSFLLIHIFVNELAMNYIIKLSITFLSGILLESSFDPLNKEREREREKTNWS